MILLDHIIEIVGLHYLDQRQQSEHFSIRSMSLMPWLFRTCQQHGSDKPAVPVRLGLVHPPASVSGLLPPKHSLKTATPSYA